MYKYIGMLHKPSAAEEVGYHVYMPGAPMGKQYWIHSGVATRYNVYEACFSKLACHMSALLMTL